MGATKRQACVCTPHVPPVARGVILARPPCQGGYGVGVVKVENFATSGRSSTSSCDAAHTQKTPHKPDGNLVLDDEAAMQASTVSAAGARSSEKCTELRAAWPGSLGKSAQIAGRNWADPQARSMCHVQARRQHALYAKISASDGRLQQLTILFTVETITGLIRNSRPYQGKQ